MKLQRKALKTLKQWKTTPDHKPLLIRGARQTGKTWLVNEFANGQYDNIVSVDFMQRPSLSGIFEQDLDPQRIIRQLELAANQRILPGRTLLFFDEIQESPLALTSLKYFTEQAPDYDIIATGSYMGISKHGKTSFPVGKVTMMNLHPLSFVEYLDSIGQDMIADTIREGRFEDIPQALEPQMNDLLKTYMWVGGMPTGFRRMCELSNKIFSTPTILIFPSMPHIRWASVSGLYGTHCHHNLPRRIANSFTVLSGKEPAPANMRKRSLG